MTVLGDWICRLTFANPAVARRNCVAGDLNVTKQLTVRGHLCTSLGTQDMLESLYSLGYNLYTSGNYKDAETVFSGLCLYDYNDPRFWMGLAGSRQANGKYQEAVDAYGLCSAMGALSSPVPVLQAGMCYLKMGDREKAKGSFVVALSMGEEGNPEHDAARGKASAMLAILEQAEK